ncbi:MAG: hypothetical protein HN377_10975 [Alphaproteobacteria bacterium]|jgi:hypothetical protein|nr:hypothetical protein [Alphaproteobacteria bacterium]MBT7944080.1 hypothetical protein [Alphaproteobacteria bacterium]
MMVMGLFGKSKKKMPPPGPPRNVSWVTSPKGQFYNFLNLDPGDHGLPGAAGVYVIWLGGRWPEWLFIGRTDDLSVSFEELQSNRDILRYDREGPLFVTWAEIRPEFRDGVVQYLNQVIPPVIPNPNPPDEDEPPIAVFPPGVTTPPPPV